MPSPIRTDQGQATEMALSVCSPAAAADEDCWTLGRCCQVVCVAEHHRAASCWPARGYVSICARLIEVRKLLKSELALVSTAPHHCACEYCLIMKPLCHLIELGATVCCPRCEVIVGDIYGEVINALLPMQGCADADLQLYELHSLKWFCHRVRAALDTNRRCRRWFVICTCAAYLHSDSCGLHYLEL